MRQYGAKFLNPRNGCQCCVPNATANGIKVRRANDGVARVNRAAKKAARQDAKKLVLEEA